MRPTPSTAGSAANSDPHVPRPAFVTTHWSVVLAAGHSDTKGAREAMARLCQTYWYPLYAHVRRQGSSPHDAQDLTQAFFEHLLEQHSIAAADRNRGRFRSFLLAALNNFLISEWKKANAQKRGGGRVILPLDLEAAERRFDLEPSDPALPPDRAFDQQWAMALLGTVLDRLDAEYAREGKSELFTALKRTLTDDGHSQTYAELGAALGMSEGAVKVAGHRLKKRYREMLQVEIASTVASSEDVLEEMQELFWALSGK